MTTRDLVERALRIIGVLAVDETAPGEYAEIGLAAYNAMIASWRLYGIDLYSADQGLNEDIDLPPEYLEPAAYILAARLQPEFSLPRTIDDARHLRLIRANYAGPENVRMPTFRARYSVSGNN